MLLATNLLLLYVFLSSLLVLLVRKIQQNKDRSWAIAFLGSCLGAIIFSSFIEPERIPQSFSMIALFLAAGTFWSLMVLFDFKSLIYNEASQNILLNCLDTVILSSLGWLIFNERISFNQIIGGVIIITSLFIMKSETFKNESRGLYFKLASIFCGCTAICLDKYLVGISGLALVVFAGYFTPAIMYLFCKPKDWKTQLAINEKKYLVLTALAILMYVLIGPIYVYAYSFGSLISTALVSQSKIVLTLLLAIWILNERSNLKLKLFCGALNIIGVGLVFT